MGDFVQKWDLNTSRSKMDYEAIASTMRARRKALELTQDEVALLANIDRRTLSEFETSAGTRGITLRNLLSIADVLGVAVGVTAIDTDYS
jgi:transcriptional regulator with XRE-family HTH domain